MNKIELPYRVFQTAAYPAKWKVARFPDDDNATCNFFRTFALAQAEANKRNKKKKETAKDG